MKKILDPSRQSAVWPEQASVCHSHGWMKAGGLQWEGVQPLDEVPAVVLQDAA